LLVFSHDIRGIFLDVSGVSAITLPINSGHHLTGSDN